MTELRIMVYEHISPVTTQHQLDLQSTFSTTHEFGVTVMRQYLSTAILATSSFIRQEAEPIMLKGLVALEQQPLRVECSVEDLYEMYQLAKERRNISADEASSLSMILGYITKLYPAYWARISRVSHTPQRPRRHLEIALTTSQTFSWVLMMWVWLSLWYDIHRDGVSCTVYHRGTLPPLPAQTGMRFWHDTRLTAIGMTALYGVQVADGVDPDDIV